MITTLLPIIRSTDRVKRTEHVLRGQTNNNNTSDHTKASTQSARKHSRLTTRQAFSGLHVLLHNSYKTLAGN